MSGYLLEGDCAQRFHGRGERHRLAGVEDRLLWYDSLPYLRLSRAAERRLLAGLTTAALPDDADPAIARGPAHADTLAAHGEPLRPLQEITRGYEASVMVFEEDQRYASSRPQPRPAKPSTNA